MHESPAYPAVHMIYFPWDRHQRLHADPEDFDRAPYEAMTDYAHPIPVELWTYRRAMAFCKREYPEIAELLRDAPRPVMLVDVLRWVLIYHFGGLYIQYNTVPLVPISGLLPSETATVRLFTEFELNAEQCQAAAAYPIRQGLPEEPIRILIQCFSAKPRAPFVKKLLDLLLERMRTLAPQCDYDILFITGNAAASTAYDRYGKEDPDVEQIGVAESRQTLKWFYCGSWRTERAHGPDASRGAQPAEVPHRVGHMGRAIRSFWYRFVTSHPHVPLLEEGGSRCASGASSSSGDLRVGCTGSRKSQLSPKLVDLFRGLDVHSISEIPCGLVEPAQIEGVMRYFGGDLDQGILAENRSRLSQMPAQFRKINLLYERPPKCDLVICAGLLELLSFREIYRILGNLLACKTKYLCIATHPYLRTNWDTALGDYRPLNLEVEPFCFPKPYASTLRCRDASRSDLCLAIWPVGEIRDVAL